MGPKYCCVPGCSNTSASLMDDGTKVILHRLPMSESRLHIKKQWICRLKNVRANLIVNDNTRVCSCHFEGEFNESSVPTIFPSKPQKQMKERRTLLRTIQFTDQNKDPNNNDMQEYNERSSKNDQVQVNHVNVDNVLPKYNVKTFKDSEVGTDKIQISEMGVQAGEVVTVDVGVQVNFPDIMPEDLNGNNEKTRFYTGFISFAMFLHYFSTTLKHGADKLHYWEGEKRYNNSEKLYHQTDNSKPGPKRSLRPFDEFLMVCMRLRLGLLQEHLADIFHVSKTSVSRILNTWINFLYDHAKSLVPWPTREQILCNLPKNFLDYKTCRIVIDCTEVFTEKPSSLTAQWLTWSEYKHSNTFKVLVGVAPNGLVTFISRLWGGNASDRHIVENDGLLPKLTSGDMIMADKGFTIEDLLQEDIDLNMPPRIPGYRQMTTNEFFATQGIASARIVVEMKMEQFKNYRILAGSLPLSESHLAEQIIFLCLAWTNLLPPLMK